LYVPFAVITLTMVNPPLSVNWSSPADVLDLVETNIAEIFDRVKLTITDHTGGGIALAWDSTSTPANGLIAKFDRVTNKVVVEKWLAGAFSSELISVSATYSAGSILEVLLHDSDVNGTWDIKVRYNGVTIGDATFSDANIIGNTIHGLSQLTDGGYAEDENGWHSNFGSVYDKFFPALIVGMMAAAAFNQGYSLGFLS